MRYIPISQEELLKIKGLHESILSTASHGLFYSVGRIFGMDMVCKIKDRDRFFEEASNILTKRNFVEDISFDDKKVTVGGSIEVREADRPSCDILRGILVILYNERYGKQLYCEETQCASSGVDKCIFEMKEDVI